MAQQVKDLELSLMRLGLLLWHSFNPWVQEFLHAASAANKKRERAIVTTKSIIIS